MKERNSQGGTLSFIIVSALALVVIGLGGFFIMKLIGGHRELGNAADSGSLSIAKDGVQIPTVSQDALAALAFPGDPSPFDGLIDFHSKGINLQSYNRAVGQAFLVALNAEADKSPGGIQNARRLIQSLQGPNGIGSQLAEKLRNPGTGDKSWVENAFKPAANSNSLRMLNNGKSEAKIDYSVNAENYQVSFLRPQSSELDTSNTNIELNQNFEKQVPFDDYSGAQHIAVPENATASDQEHCYKSLRGYDPIKFPHVGSLCAVTVSPFEQAHLVSNKSFADCLINPAANQGLVVPPNSFQTVVSAVDQKSSLNLKVQTSSLVGTAAISRSMPLNDPNTAQLSAVMSKYDLAIPRGYLIIDNEGDGKDSSYLGIVPQMNTKSELWYHTTGVSVDEQTGCFSNNGQVENWMAYNDSIKNKQPGAPTLAQPSLDGLYNSSGNPASLELAKQISPASSPSPCKCNDLNSDPSAPGSIPICSAYAKSVPGQTGPFDTAYHPSYLNPPQYGNSSAQLTAAELAKMNVWENYVWSWFGKIVYIDRTTGARVYPKGAYDPLSVLPGVPATVATPYNAKPGSPMTLGANVSQAAIDYSDPLVPGRVSKEGSLMTLMEQVSSHSLNPFALAEMRRFLENRLWQIKPDASQAEIDALITLAPIEMKQKYYLYLDSNRNFQLSKNAPFWVNPKSPSQTTPDGKLHTYNSNPYNLVGTLVNSPADFNIHEKPFLDDSKSLMLGQLTASFTPSSGANNLLGLLKFSERAWGAGLFTNAN